MNPELEDKPTKSFAELADEINADAEVADLFAEDDAQGPALDGSHRTSVANIFGLKERPVVKTPHAIEQFEFDKDIYDDIYNQSQMMQETVANGMKQIKTFDKLSEDLFHSLYKHQPRLKNHEEIDEMSHFNRDLLGELLETEDYQKLRMSTRHDVLSSAIGTEVMQEEATTRIKMIRQQMNDQAKQDPSGQTMSGDQFFDLLNQIIEGQQQQQQAQNQLNALAGDAGQPGGQGQPQAGSGQMSNQPQGPSMTPEQAKALADAAAQQQQQAQQQVQQAQQALADAQANGQNPMQAMNQAMASAAKAANDEVTEVQDFLNAWGMEGGDKNRRITYEDKKRALQRLRNSNKLKKLTDLIGRFRALVNQEMKKKSNDGATAVKSVKTGDQIQHILPSELMQLKNPITRKNFLRKMGEKSLLMYDKVSERPKGRGPVIACCDVSGSMEGKAEEWSKAMSLALLEITQKQKRAYAYIGFDHQIQDVYEIPYGSLKPEMVFDIAERFSGGGTNFEQPLRKALDIMKGQKFKKGDIIFITDGSASVSDSFLKEFKRVKAEKEFTVRTILVNVGSWGSDGIVKEFSDEVVTLSSLADLNDKSAMQIFADVQSDDQ